MTDFELNASKWFFARGGAPKGAFEFAQRRCRRVGGCSEVILSAYVDYQRIEANGGVCPDCGGAGDAMCPNACATCL